MKKTIKFGIFGLGRGGSFFDNVLVNNGEIVAVCDTIQQRLDNTKKRFPDVATYKDFDEFISHPGLEAVFICNYFHEHVPYAIKALEKGIHVLSECTSNGTMAEGVALVRAAEKSKAIYMLAENYPFMQFNQEMRKVYRGGSLGKVLFAEGEYNHPFDPTDYGSIRHLRPYEKHWRNYVPRTYYITHSLAPLIYITGAKPIRITAMPVFSATPMDMLGGIMVGDKAAVVTCLNDDESVYRVTGCAAFGAHDNSYRICGVKGQIENVRGGGGKVMLRYNSWDVPEGMQEDNYYMPQLNDADKELIEKAGHGGGDFYVIREFFDCIREGRKPEFDVYFATTLASVGILAHRSLLEKGAPYDIPDFHKEEDRKKYENDYLTPFYGSDGSEPTLPCCSKPDYLPAPEEVEKYQKILRREIQ